MLSLSIIFSIVTVQFSVQLVKCSQMAAGAITEPLKELRTYCTNDCKKKLH